MRHADRPVGNVRTSPPGVLADRCARRILEFASPRAVTIDPEGRVYVESVDDAAEADLLGVYTRDLGLLELSRRLIDELRDEAAKRREPGPSRHVVVSTSGNRQRWSGYVPKEPPPKMPRPARVRARPSKELRDAMERAHPCKYVIEGTRYAHVEGVYREAVARGFDGSMGTIWGRISRGVTTWEEVARPVNRGKQRGGQTVQRAKREEIQDTIEQLDRRNKAA